MVSTPQTNSNPQTFKPKQNTVFGNIITCLSYQENGNNLVEVKVKENSSANIFTFTAFCNVNLDSSTIKIVNLNDFSYRLQEFFYKNNGNDFLLIITYEDDKIVLLEIKRRIIIQTASFPSPGTGGGG